MQHQFKKTTEGFVDENNVFYTDFEVEEYLAENPVLEIDTHE